MYRVREINEFAELAELRETWHRLLRQTSHATFFRTFEWLDTYWRHFAGQQKLRTLVISNGQQVAGILPLVVRLERRKVGTLRTLTYPLDHWGAFYGPIGPDPQAILAAGLRHIRRTRRDWDLVDVRFVDEAADYGDATRAAVDHSGFKFHRQVCDRVPVIRLPDSFDDYLASRTRKWREGLRRLQRRGRGGEPFVYERHVLPAGTSDPRWDLYDSCSDVARRSWQGESTNGTTLSHPSVRPFLRDMHAVATRLGAADINLIRHSGRPVAFAYNYVWHGHLFGLRTGFDAQFSRDGVGNLLLVNMIRDSIDRGWHTFDLGPGSLAAKKRFQTEVRNVGQYIHYAPAAPRAQLLRLKHVWQKVWQWVAGRPRPPLGGLTRPADVRAASRSDFGGF